MIISKDYQRRMLTVEMTPEEYAGYRGDELPPNINERARTIQIEREKMLDVVGACEMTIIVGSGGSAPAPKLKRIGNFV